MQVQADIAFDQLLEIVKSLPAPQLKQLKAELKKSLSSLNSLLT